MKLPPLPLYIIIPPGSGASHPRGCWHRVGREVLRLRMPEGADICVNYRRDAADADAVRQRIEGIGRRAIAVQADVARLADIRRLVNETVSTLDRLDFLVNNAGIEIEQRPRRRGRRRGVGDPVGG